MACSKPDQRQTRYRRFMLGVVSRSLRVAVPIRHRLRVSYRQSVGRFAHRSNSKTPGIKDQNPNLCDNLSLTKIT